MSDSTSKTFRSTLQNICKTTISGIFPQWYIYFTFTQYFLFCCFNTSNNSTFFLLTNILEPVSSLFFPCAVSWLRNGILQFSTSSRKKTTKPFPSPPSSGEQKREGSWVEIRAFCWKQKYDDKASNNSTSISYRSVQRKCDLHAICSTMKNSGGQTFCPSRFPLMGKGTSFLHRRERVPFPWTLAMV